MALLDDMLMNMFFHTNVYFNYIRKVQYAHQSHDFMDFIPQN